MELNLKGKNALVTGGSHGIGRSIALSLAKEGCNVAVCSRSLELLNETRLQIECSGNKCLTFQIDVTKQYDVDYMLDSLYLNWGGINILINNVGGGGRWGNDYVENTKPEIWQEVYDKNAKAAIKFTMGSIPFMKDNNWGRVVTISSILGKEGGGRPWFNMAKAAEISLMKTLSMDYKLAGKGITFNTICPGNIMIEGTGWEKEKEADPDGHKLFIQNNCPRGSMGTPEEVASVVTFLCSEQASLVNGACIAVDGGESKSF